jgi:hypothetical protein
LLKKNKIGNDIIVIIIIIDDGDVIDDAAVTWMGGCR